MNPKITIIVPVYKAENTLDKCVDTLINQTLHNIDILLIDDGSPDNCPQMCDKWAAKDNRIRVIHKQNAGLGMARNTGIENVHGEYFTFLDSDDWVALDFYEKIYAFAKKYDLDASYSRGLIYVDENGKEVKQRTGPTTERFYLTNKECKELALDCISTRNRCAHNIRDISVNIGIYKTDKIRSLSLCFVSEREYSSEDLIFDVEMLSRLSRVAILPQSFYYYYQNSQSLSHTYNTNRFQKQISQHKKLIEILSNSDYTTFDFNIVHKKLLESTREYIYEIFRCYDDRRSRIIEIKRIISQKDEWKKIKSWRLFGILPKRLKLFYFCIYLMSPLLLYCYGWSVIKFKIKILILLK